MNRCRPEKKTRRARQHVANNPKLEEGDTNAKGWNVGGEKKSHKERVQEAKGRMRSWRFHGAKRVVEHHQKKNVGRHHLERRET